MNEKPENKGLIAWFKNMSFSMVKYGITSMLGSLIDLAVFTFIASKVLSLFNAEIVSAFCGMIVNFFMHKRFVFNLDRKGYVAFILSISFSIVIMTIGGFMMEFLGGIGFFASNLIIAKVLVMGIKFGLNYFTKRWVFERKIFKY